jgi:DNA processing protein
MPLRDYLHLALAAGIGPITIRRMIDALGSAHAAANATATQLQQIEGIGPAKSRNIHAALRSTRDLVDAELARADKLGIRLICIESPEYPPLLRHIPDPPAVLYMKGNLEPRDLNGIAVVGSRKCSYYGREQAERFAALLAGAGMTVLSGGARGVDSAAHRGAMQPTAGRTIAVLGCGVDVVYPPENASLFDQIAQRGAVLSEYPLGTPPTPENFPRRNRIVSGMSRGVLVIEADERSGALITARQCIEDHDRPVFALPGRVDNPLSAGPHKLIREGAVLVTGLEDILDNLDPLPHDIVAPDIHLDLESSPPDAPPPQAPAAPAPETIGLTDRQRTILLHLGADPTPIDSLIERTAFAAHEILQDLTFLSLRGLVRRIDGQTYARHQRP